MYVMKIKRMILVKISILAYQMNLNIQYNSVVTKFILILQRERKNIKYYRVNLFLT